MENIPEKDSLKNENEFTIPPELILMFYRYDPSSYFNVFPLEIIYIILDCLYSMTIIEFEFSSTSAVILSVATGDKQHLKSIGDDEGITKEVLSFTIIPIITFCFIHFFSLGSNWENKVFIFCASKHIVEDRNIFN